MADSKKSSWLFLETKYIDQNIDNFCSYIIERIKTSNCANDSFYKDSVDLLIKRVDEVVEEFSNNDIFYEVRDDNEGYDGLETKIKILYIFLQLNVTDNIRLYKEAAFYFFYALSLLYPKYSEKLVCCAKKALKYNKITFKEKNVGIQECDISKLCDFTEFDCANSLDWIYFGKGRLELSEGKVIIRNYLSTNQQNNYKTDLLNESITIYSNSKGDIKIDDLEQSLLNIEDFTKLYNRSLNILENASAKRKYHSNDKVNVRYEGYENGRLRVKTVDPNYETIEGYISESYYVYTPEVLSKYLQKGDIIEAVLSDDDEFKISDIFNDLIKEKFDDTNRSVVLAKLVRLNNRSLWWTEDGYSVYPGQHFSASNNEVWLLSLRYDVNTNVIVIEHQENINEVDWEENNITDDVVNSIKSKEFVDNTIKEFISSFKKSDCQQVKEIDNRIFRGIARMIFHEQRSYSTLSKKYLNLSVARIISSICRDEKAVENLEFFQTYLFNIECFVNSQYGNVLDLPKVEEPNKYILDRINTDYLLRSFNDNTKEEEIKEFIRSETDSLNGNIAKLVLAYNSLNDQLSESIKGVFKREIIKFLSIQFDDNTNLEEKLGPNFGMESAILEFKTSFFFPPKNAKEQNQSKVIMQTICAFLNADSGGKILIGVNDQGYISGLEEELKQVEQINYGSYHGIDGYIRYITDVGIKYFDPLIMNNVSIVPINNNQVISISIKPYDTVVECDGEAFIRVGSEKRLLTAEEKNQLRHKKTSQGSQALKNIIQTINNALESKQQLKLVNYSSLNSSSVKDRVLEPISLIGDNKFLWAYEVSSDTNKLFKLSRMEDVDMMKDKCCHMDRYILPKTDIFYYGDSDYKYEVLVELDFIARGLLLEDFPLSKNQIYPLGEKWVLKTKVNNLEGITRFCLGVLNNVKVIKCQELKDNIAQKIANYHNNG